MLNIYVYITSFFCLRFFIFNSLPPFCLAHFAFFLFPSTVVVIIIKFWNIAFDTSPLSLKWVLVLFLTISVISFDIYHFPSFLTSFSLQLSVFSCLFLISFWCSFSIFAAFSFSCWICVVRTGIRLKSLGLVLLFWVRAMHCFLFTTLPT